MKSKLSTLSFLLLTLFLPYSSWAEDSGKFSVGIAYINGSSIYSNTKNSRIIMPSLSYETDKININVQNGFTYKIINDQIHLAPGDTTPGTSNTFYFPALQTHPSFKLIG